MRTIGKPCGCLALVTLLTACGSASSPEHSSGRSAQTINDPTCDVPGSLAPLLVVINGSDDPAMCSGILTDSAHVLTAQHCMPATSVTLIGVDPQQTAAVSSASQIGSNDATTLTLATPVSPGVSYVATGSYGDGSCAVYGQMTDGVAQGEFACRDGFSLSLTDAPCNIGLPGSDCLATVGDLTNRGDSGGPVICNGVIVGVTSAYAHGVTGWAPVSAQ